jgi:monoamine oxidase
MLDILRPAAHKFHAAGRATALTPPQTRTVRRPSAKLSVVSLYHHEVVIVGAGVAGLAAMHTLVRAGRSVLCLEARNRIGGRICTHHDPLLPIPVELGAEFIHGRAREIWELIEAANLAAYDVLGRAVRIEDGQVLERGDIWERIDRVMEDMRRSAESGPDKSFQEFIESTSHPEDVKRLASAYVEGFNAARKEVIGIASLAHEARASEQIDGDHAFRIFNGYDAIPLYLLHSTPDWPARLHLNTIVERIEWQSGSVKLSVRSASGNALETIHSRLAILTVPLGVLQCGAIRFEPEPADALAAARQLAFGQVMRVTLRFRDTFWHDQDALAGAGFLLSHHPCFPTWWTTLPVHTPLITGWSAGPRSDALLGQPRREVIREAIRALAQLLGIQRERLEASLEQAYLHDWHQDPFARGAYSYAPAGALPARTMLAQPVKDTLFFAGEAAETDGHSATVHGAIRSGIRAAQLALQALRN